MIYAFRDINEEVSLIPLPSEAMQINGVYIENEIEGYRTLYVKGRESLSPEFETVEINTKDGSMRKSRKYPARIITVGYQLRADSAEAFREAKQNKKGPTLIEFMMDPEDIVYPMIQPGGTLEDMIMDC